MRQEKWEREPFGVMTEEYECSHGKKPRGFGHWAFRFHQSWRSEAEPRFYTGTYGEAKQRAMRDAKAAGCTSMSVLS